MNFVADNTSYEQWLAGFGPLNPDELKHKHEKFAEPFPFFRGTYFRWARLWPTVCHDLADAPRVLAVGDLHVENFGTWRDADGRLCWGVNDFDEVDALPYTGDLVRLAASARFAKKAGVLAVKFEDACTAILDGYRGCLVEGGRSFVLEENHPDLRAMAMTRTDDRDPPKFWTKFTKLLEHPPADPPPAAREGLLAALPAADLVPDYRARPDAGMGSLGKARFVALVRWRGGWVCREAKAATPPATAWLVGRTDRGGLRAAEAAAAAVRSPDPFYLPGPAWVIRRLAPRCSRLDLEELAKADVMHVLHAMGAETANVHLGTRQMAQDILRDLDRRPAGWLAAAGRAMTDALTADWEEWQRSPTPAAAPH